MFASLQDHQNSTLTAKVPVLHCALAKPSRIAKTLTRIDDENRP